VIGRHKPKASSFEGEFIGIVPDDGPGASRIVATAVIRNPSHSRKSSLLFDHLGGDAEQPGRHCDAERSRRSTVDEELKLG
jgi:hypothetical protein